MTQLPDKFKLQVAQLLGQEEADGLCRALLEEPTVSVRVNRAKAGCPPQDVENERVPGAKQAIISLRALRLRSIRFSMPEPIMCRRPLPCL